MLLPLLVVLACTAQSFATVYTSHTGLPANAIYDLIIVGGGTAGSVLANRLTEDPRVKVLIIEAGNTPEAVFNTRVPFLASSLRNTTVDWNFTSTTQPGLDNRSLWYERGHVLGGSSVVNLMAFNRGSDDVWNNWAQLTGDSGWSWKSMLPYYMKTSRIVPPADHHNTTGQFIPAAHGHGPVEVSLPGFPSILNEPVLDTAKNLGGRFSYQEDLNAGNFTGFSYCQSSVGQGQRSHAERAYIAPVRNRANLDVVLNTRATKLINTGSSSAPVFKTVQFGTNSSDLRTLRASKELILSTGAFGTPQLLLLSGIGPPHTLESLGIQPIVDLPDVGQNLTDHPLLPNYFYINSTATFDDILRNSTAFAAALSKWNTTKQGPLVIPSATTMAFMRFDADSAIIKQYGDPSSGPLSAHTELLFINGFQRLSTIPQPATGHYMTVLTSVVSPMSRGSMTLASSDPFANPVIDPQMLVHGFDSSAMAQSMTDVQTFLGQPLFARFNITPFGALADATTQAEQIAYARNLTVTLNHPVGTARMTAADAPDGVVDSTLLLKKASGLRIVDASVFPQIPECHPQAVVYTLAERAADLVKADWHLS
ncbi:aryl-alcohol-oxidase from pleurotus Eryingii [Mycena sp. CBHHK59/15]|nr:aryl-alcohol-oxidase from pleurotus Eryingii [Mycena sp. CBHHK59/15]